MTENQAHAIGALTAGGMIFFGGIIILFFCWLGALIDVLRSDFKNKNSKTTWMLLLIFLAPLATILYMIMGNEQKKKPEKREIGMIKENPNRDAKNGRWF